MSHKISSKIFLLLQTEWLGRPIRKILWVLYSTSQKLAKVSEKLLLKHPYIKKISTNGLICNPPTNRAKQDYLLNETDQALFRYYTQLTMTLERFKIQPKISILIPVYKVKRSFLEDCLDSISAQIYPNWEACIVDDASQQDDIKKVIKSFIQRHGSKVVAISNDRNMHISYSTNQALKMATGDYVTTLDHDDKLLPNALAEVIRFINLYSEPDILYSDESIIDEKGNVLATFNKPAWSPLMHLSFNYTSHLSIYKIELVKNLGGFRNGFEGAQDHDLMLRAVEATSKPIIHIPIVLYQWRAHDLSTAKDSAIKPYATDAGKRAITEACLRRNYPAEVQFESEMHHFKVKHEIKKPLPLISIIIPSKDSYKILKACLQSIYRKTSYKNYEVIIIDHDSKDHNCIAVYQDFKERYPNQFRLIEFKGGFNYAAMNNLGARHARGQYLVLLNNDTEVLNSEWITELLSIAQLPSVGAAGPKLLYPNNTIQHAGVMGFGPQIAGHIATGEPAESRLYFGYIQTTHEVLAVTGACLMVSKQKFEAVNGLEEIYVPNGFGDLDFCLKLSEKGFANVYVPYALLQHKESTTRKTSFELFESYYMQKNWARELTSDPYRNPVFEIGPNFNVREQFKVQAPSLLFSKSLFTTKI